MKQLFLPFLFLMFIACNRDKTLTNREKLDSIEPGMTLSEVLDIYGPLDTIGRTSRAGDCGGELDTATLTVIPGPEGNIPLISVMMNDSTALLFARGKLMLKPQQTWDEMKKDTLWLHIDSLLDERMKKGKAL